MKKIYRIKQFLINRNVKDISSSYFNLLNMIYLQNFILLLQFSFKKEIYYIYNTENL